ncbi:urea amidolyase family protein [Paracoccus sp. (in: a-proteobacteria)]|uniref:5-oxoprolinase subunit B/C family protein n=1 Tax=Paracoccus sp. TaxID=267 RepID=UPI00321FA671
MTADLRLLPAGSDGLLVELADLPAMLALLEALRAAPPEGITDIVPGARTLLLRFDPLALNPKALAAHLHTLDLTAACPPQGQLHDIPVIYDGEDLAEVAAHLGCSVPELIARHQAATFTVAFTGFAPGFAYMTSDDPALDVPRRKVPRKRIPAGSVALAGVFGGIYPSDSPGGWQLLGRTPVPMWDLMRARPALLAPGDRVRFRDMGRDAVIAPAAIPTPRPQQGDGLRILRADRPALLQDAGRPGQAGQGVSGSGALDRASLHAANRCLGNPRDAAALEITFGGLTLRAERALTLALTGADCPLRITGPRGDATPEHGRAFAMDAGDELQIGPPRHGCYSYLGLRGGYLAAPVLGSAARDTLARLGPEPLTTGDRLTPANLPAGAVDPCPRAQPRLPQPGETVTLQVILGPRADRFTTAARQCFLDQTWQVTPEISRTGKRLSGAQPLRRRDNTELPSEGTVPGAIQIPHSGQPVLFLADHPLTGGYPVIAVVARHHLDLAAQIPPGAQIRFHPVPGPIKEAKP